MGRSIVALDLGGSTIRAAQFTPGTKKTGLTISKVTAIDTPDGLIENGEVKDVDGLAAALKDLWGIGKFTSKRVVFGLANQNTLVRQIDLDWMEDDAFDRSLQYQVADFLPSPPEDFILTSHLLDQFTVEDANGIPQKMNRILLVAATKTMVADFTEAVTKAGLEPVQAELVPFALVRASEPQEPDPELAEAVIDLGADNTNVIVHQGGQPRFVRIVSGQAGRHLTRTLAEQFGWSETDAEKAKVELGLRAAIDDNGQPHPAQYVINHVISALINEIRTSIDFFLQATPQVQAINRIVLTGGGSHFKGLPQRLASELRVPVEVADPLAAVTTKTKADNPHTGDPRMGVAVGLAMGAH